MFDEHDEDEAGERQVLEQAGLLEVDPSRTPDQRPISRSMALSEDMGDRSKRTSAIGTDKDKIDRSKLRRSLQRTLREGAGHLSHHRSRKGKDSATGSAMSDETVRDASTTLSRGSGSFTVHGKKASVINFGSELQHLSQEERMWQRKQSTTTDDGMLSPISMDDFHSIIDEPLPTVNDRERRESAASASTATARSFRELHRKYSSAQHAKTSQSGSGGLAVAGHEDDSDAAVSFSDGRRTPLPPVDDGSDEEEDKNEDDEADDDEEDAGGQGDAVVVYA